MPGPPPGLDKMEQNELRNVSSNFRFLCNMSMFEAVGGRTTLVQLLNVAKEWYNGNSLGQIAINMRNIRGFTCCRSLQSIKLCSIRGCFKVQSSVPDPAASVCSEISLRDLCRQPDLKDAARSRLSGDKL